MTERTILSRTASEDPAPSRPAPAGRRVAAQAAYETRTMLRNGEQLLVALGQTRPQAARGQQQPPDLAPAVGDRQRAHVARAGAEHRREPRTAAAVHLDGHERDPERLPDLEGHVRLPPREHELHDHGERRADDGAGDRDDEVAACGQGTTPSR